MTFFARYLSRSHSIKAAIAPKPIKTSPEKLVKNQIPQTINPIRRTKKNNSPNRLSNKGESAIINAAMRMILSMRQLYPLTFSRGTDQGPNCLALALCAFLIFLLNHSGLSCILAIVSLQSQYITYESSTARPLPLGQRIRCNGIHPPLPTQRACAGKVARGRDWVELRSDASLDEPSEPLSPYDRLDRNNNLGHLSNPVKFTDYLDNRPSLQIMGIV